MKLLSWQFLLGIITVIIVGFVLFGYFSSRVERPQYEVLSRSDNIELRRYPSMLVAQVEVGGAREKAINKGFRLLADYIFGNNTRQTKISMTAPVTQQSQKIAMTAPVMQQRAGDGDKWVVRFVMPKEFSMETVPKPNNAVIKLINVPEQKRIVIRFSGYSTQENLSVHLKRLNQVIIEEKLVVSGEPEYAFYNPPWTLGFMRTNEISYVLD